MKSPQAHTRRLLVCSSVLVFLLLASKASAAPITAGVWSSVTDVNNDRSAFWDGLSWDCGTCNVGFLLSGHAGLEYLHDGDGNAAAFLFDDPTIELTETFSNTAWTDGVLGRDAEGAFTYDSGTGRLSNSRHSSQQYALFRRVTAEATQYFMGIEDILVSESENDHDYNDYGVTFTLPTQRIPDEKVELQLTTLSVEQETTSELVPVPEPSTIVLTGMSIAGLLARRSRRRTAVKPSAADVP